MPCRTLRHPAFTPLALFASFLLSGLFAPARAQQPLKGGAPPSKAEAFVLAKVKAGERADFSLTPGQPKVISGDFLRRLLTDPAGAKSAPRGVAIKGAEVEGPLAIENADIPYSVSFVSCTFRGLVSFVHVKLHGSLNISGTFDRFASHCGTREDPPGSVFEDQFLFIDVTVDGDIYARNSAFRWKPRCNPACTSAKSACDAADFEEAKVANDAVFDGATFEGPADFEGAHFAQVLFAAGAHFNGLANFVDIRVKDDFELDGSTFATGADFSRAEVENKFSLADTVFADDRDGVVLQDVKVGQLTLSAKPADEMFRGTPHIGGLTYQRIAMADPHEDLKAWEIWHNVLRKTEYRVDGYKALEAFVLKQGYPSRANAIYISQRDREAGEIYARSGPRGVALWLWDTFLKWTVGYGRRPWLAFIYSVLVIAAGCLAFPQDKMELHERDEKPRLYSRFWYSVDLFLPVVDLRSSSFWMPKTQHAWLWSYMHVHALLGWVLIPIGLAAVTGILE